MTPAEALVDRTTRASGVPRTIEDPTTLARLAALCANRKAPPAIGTPGEAKEERRVALAHSRADRHAKHEVRAVGTVAVGALAVAAAGYDPDPFLRRAFALWEEEQNLTDDGTLTSLANAVNLPGATPKDPQTSSKIA